MSYRRYVSDAALALSLLALGRTFGEAGLPFMFLAVVWAVYSMILHPILWHRYKKAWEFFHNHVRQED